MDDLLVYLLIAGAIGFGVLSLIFFLLEWRRLRLWKKLLEEVRGDASK